MKKTAMFIVFAVLFCSICIGDELDPTQDPNICDCNCVCEALEPLPIAYLFEDFNDSFSLNWHILGEDPLYWSLETVPGALTIRTQTGSFEFSYTDYKNVFLIDFPVSQLLDFQITTCISNCKPRDSWNQAGLLLWNDEDNYLKFVYEYGNDTPYGHGLLFTVGQQIYGDSYFNWYLTEQTPQTMWLRIIKRGEVYEFYNSTDGETFLPLELFRGFAYFDNEENVFPCLPEPINNIGIFASNGTAIDTLEINASFEYFEFMTLPVEPNMPEDPNEN